MPCKTKPICPVKPHRITIQKQVEWPSKSMLNCPTKLCWIAILFLFCCFAVVVFGIPVDQNLLSKRNWIHWIKGMILLNKRTMGIVGQKELESLCKKNWIYWTKDWIKEILNQKNQSPKILGCLAQCQPQKF